tara:strand:+ start:10 stop:606 length:597 start_codon:yes stop_codon:yes gene_type:complete
MSDFSDFFPAAGGGGGGFTKSNSYSTARALDMFDYNNAASYTVNPASDLGLADGASIGYFMVNGGNKTAAGGGGGTYGEGGKIIMGTTIISNASTNLVLTPGVGILTANNGYSQGTASTISGGLTLTTADGSSRSGTPGYTSSGYLNPGIGVNGYGQGSMGYSQSNSAKTGAPIHGTGGSVGAIGANSGSDGAIILYY